MFANRGGPESPYKNDWNNIQPRMQLRLETFNVFNVRIYGGPNTNPNSANFGIVDTASQVTPFSLLPFPFSLSQRLRCPRARRP